MSTTFDKSLVVRLNIVSNHEKNNVDFVFRNYHYVIVKTKIFHDINDKKSKMKKKIICFDFECSLTLNDRDFMKKQLDEMKIRKLIFSISIRNVKKTKKNK